MAKKHKKAQPVNMKQKNDNYVGTIKGMDIVKHRSEGFQPLPCKTGWQKTKKDYKRERICIHKIEY